MQKSGWSLKVLAKPEDKWIVGLEVQGLVSFTLVAVWSCPEQTGYKHYVDVVRRALQNHPEWFTTGDAVVAGDFNSNGQWHQQTKGGHASLVSELESKGLASAYHSHFPEEQQSKETRPTFHQHWNKDKPFHIDYVFIPDTWKIERLEVGGPEEWLEHSDHCPIILDASPTA